MQTYWYLNGEILSNYFAKRYFSGVVYSQGCCIVAKSRSHAAWKCKNQLGLVLS